MLSAWASGRCVALGPAGPPSWGHAAVPAWRCLADAVLNATAPSIRALLRALPPPGVIFAPGRGPAVLVGLQTADHRRLASPVQEAQGPPAPGDRTRIVRFPVGE